jgi:hypothetical protein
MQPAGRLLLCAGCIINYLLDMNVRYLSALAFGGDTSASFSLVYGLTCRGKSGGRYEMFYSHNVPRMQCLPRFVAKEAAWMRVEGGHATSLALLCTYTSVGRTSSREGH